MTNKLTESAIEDLAIEQFEKLGYQYLYAPSIAPDKVNGEAREGALGYSDTPERERFEDVVLLERLRYAAGKWRKKAMCKKCMLQTQIARSPLFPYQNQPFEEKRTGE